MRSSAMASLAAFFFFAVYTAPVALGQGSDINCERSDLDGFENMHSPAEGFLIYWNHPTDSISFRVEVISQEWAAVGFSEDGLMVGSDAVIFLPEEDDVSEHILGSQSVSDILPSDVTELSDTSFEQEDGDTVFWFTRNTTPKDLTSDKLVIPNIPDQPIYIIWAKGMDNGFGYHGAANRGSFFVDLFCPELETPAPTPGATLATAAPVATVVSPPSFTLPPGGVAGTAPPATAAAPTADPVAPPTAEPVAAPTAEPVVAATAAPVAPPTAEPVAAATTAPVAAPTAEPVAAPTAEPVAAPTAEPVTTTMPIAAPTVDEAAPTAGDEAEATTEPAAAPTTEDSASTRAPVGTPSATESPVGVVEELAPSDPTPSPTAGSRGDIGATGGDSTESPTPSATGYTGGAASLGGGADGAAVTSAVVAACVAVVWARWN